MIEIIEQGMSCWVAEPTFGRQHLGFAPGGAADQFAMRIANLMLGLPQENPCLEIGLFPPKLRFKEDATFLLNGAARDAWLKREGKTMDIPFATVTLAQAGDELCFGDLKKGLRTYLAAKPDHDLAREGLTRPSFADIANWPDPQGLIRIMPGPEFPLLQDQQVLVGQSFKVSPRSSSIGLRLDEPHVELSQTSMTSQPVADGTIQATPQGLIILLRDRPTVGGYPRLANVISPDLDVLAQVAPGQLIRFRWVTRAEALQIDEQHRRDLAELKKRLG